jgi:hypothetical protein
MPYRYEENDMAGETLFSFYFFFIYLSTCILHGWLPSLAYSMLHCLLFALRATGDDQYPARIDPSVSRCNNLQPRYPTSTKLRRL